ncbi:hypothetical protein [Streptomyces sp. 5-6(2022)]|uniref:hypothetical protein n=1 Tax=Streptomyces sp. 5-6(2022) TaxID=2936510 RepID=UPI0023B97C4E|nr:hypothetical protein [Streptomyces sp. 5-6(2022)]
MNLRPLAPQRPPSPAPWPARSEQPDRDPHIAGQTTQSLLAAGTQALACIRQALTGQTPDHAVNTVTSVIERTQAQEQTEQKMRDAINASLGGLINEYGHAA